MLGDLGVEMEWSETARCRDDAGMGQEDDLEGASSGSATQPPSIHKGDCAREGGNGGS